MYLTSMFHHFWYFNDLILTLFLVVFLMW
ncbi:hypothetical protein Ahy_A03g016513 isoform B [Arachis hypogaea]|uniref:Uncharacterized protein n=1 Tax=Arachis hypogaea TaxID=3818 RepID=A0A445E3H8_ARAHY|nr:hypothetical protein Ahy_A03g016513 isoform B [Arachis hypogaea]